MCLNIQIYNILKENKEVKTRTKKRESEKSQIFKKISPLKT